MQRIQLDFDTRQPQRSRWQKYGQRKNATHTSFIETDQEDVSPGGCSGASKR